MIEKHHTKSNVPQIILLRDAQIEPEQVTKVGIVPFIPHEDESLFQFMLMKPHAEKEHPGSSPEFQIAKGTRRIDMGGGWCDMRDDDLIHADPVFYENLIDTALREGEEEIGLKRGNIAKLFDIGVFYFISARRGLPKALHVFAAEIREAKNFGSFESKTAEVSWMPKSMWSSKARTDHVAILTTVHGRLIGAFFTGK